MTETDRQLRFDFMDTVPEQLSPRAEYAAYLLSIRDEKPTLKSKGGSHAAKEKGSKEFLARRKV